ncbi:MAG: thioredoxin family protein, partial [Acidimicrobiia bacterium]|nr:thioredoxin family protein [Acidimicrobiia bacterium]
MTEPTTVVDIWAPWCRPCRAMEPMVDEAASRHAGRVALEKVNADRQQARVRELKVRAVPTLIALRGDREIARLTGAQSEQAITDLFALAAGDPT